jgi:hypothetical protein
MTKQEFIELRKRLETFAEKAGKEAHDDEDIQKLAEGCIWIGATWMANALGIKGFKDKED